MVLCVIVLEWMVASS